MLEDKGKQCVSMAPLIIPAFIDRAAGFVEGASINLVHPRYATFEIKLIKNRGY